MTFNFLTIVASAMTLIVLGLQVWATLRVRRDAGSTPEQKSMQFKLIWFLPLIGAAVVLALLVDDARPGASDRSGSVSAQTMRGQSAAPRTGADRRSQPARRDG